MFVIDYNYIIILFKNKEKRKIINKFKTYDRAIKFYEKILEKSNQVIFEMKYENGFPCRYEIGLLKSGHTKEFLNFTKDEYGRQIKIELDNSNYSILNLKPFKIDEVIYDFQTKKKINIKELEKKYLSNKGIKLLSKLNNKIIIQNDDEIKLFTLKNLDDSERLINTLSEYFLKKGRNDCILVKDISTTQRKYLYDILISKGFSKSYLFRQSTTHPTKK